MLSTISEICGSFLDLLYPNICVCCSTGLMRGERYICSHCLYELPVTGFYREHDNLVEQIFWGRAAVEHATACFFFRKGNNVQKLVHQVKYQGQKEMGQVLGQYMGQQLVGSHFDEAEIIVPVPLHLQKFRKRGYNQSEWIARGVAGAMHKKINAQTLVRHIKANSQTRKKRFDRWENVNMGFRLTDPDIFAGKHILLIDDVITTGATLEACIHALKHAPGTKVSIATLAVASS